MFFCKHIQKLRNHHRHITLEKGFDFLAYEKASEVDSETWNSILQNRNLYLELGYLEILEGAGASDFKPRYVILFQKNKPVAIAYFQVIDFKASVFGEMLHSKVNQVKSTRARLFEKYVDKSKDEILLRLLTCGNNLISGEHGFLFNGNISAEKQFNIIESLIEKIGKNDKLRGKISAVLVKDFYNPVKNKPACLFKHDNYIEFSVEPNMVVPIEENVKSLNDYISLYSKKYRNRAKAILDSGKDIKIVELNEKDILKHEKDIYSLYMQVYNNAKFKLVKLPENYFSRCKKLFDSKFLVQGYFLNGKLLAFSSGIDLNNSCLEAHYIGFDYQLNRDYELYQNILYSFLSTAIEMKKKRLNLGRSAAEIKSTIGAKAQDLICYVKPQNTVSKIILKPFIQFLQPAEWIPRNPFKDDLKPATNL